MHDANEDEVSHLKRFCICIVEFISSQAIDPHLYFRQKMIGEVTQAGSIDDLIALMRRLISWVDTGDFGPARSERLDVMLSDQGFPPLSVIRNTDDKDVATRLTENH